MSATMYGSTPGAGTGQAIFTDDVSLQVFMEHLKRLVCQILLRSFRVVSRFTHVALSFFFIFARLLVLKQIKIILFYFFHFFDPVNFSFNDSIINPIVLLS